MSAAASESIIPALIAFGFIAVAFAMMLKLI